MAYKRNSHLRETRIVNGYTALYNPSVTPDYSRTFEFTITQKYVKRPDLLAYDLYGDAHFWWLFPIYNPNALLDPINDFTLETSLLVPTRDFVAGI